MNVDYKAEDVARAYVDMTGNIVNSFSKFLDKMEHKCRTHGYEPMVDFVKSLQEFYQEDLYQHIKNEYFDWENSEHSLENLARKLNAGSGAEATGRRYMQQIADEIEQMFRVHMPDLRVDVDAPSVNERDIEEIGDEIKYFIQDAQEAKEQGVSYVNSRANDNLLFACTRPIIVATGESIVQSFEDMIISTLKGADIFAENTGFVQQLVDMIIHKEISVSVGWPSEIPFN